MILCSNMPIIHHSSDLIIQKHLGKGSTNWDNSHFLVRCQQFYIFVTRRIAILAISCHSITHVKQLEILWADRVEIDKLTINFVDFFQESSNCIRADNNTTKLLNKGAFLDAIWITSHYFSYLQSFLHHKFSWASVCWSNWLYLFELVLKLDLILQAWQI